MTDHADIRLFVSDLDGTLLLEDHESVSERTGEALRKLREQGVKLCACTGRVRGLIPDAIRKIGFDYAITSNGAVCEDLRSGEKVFTAYMNENKARFLYRVMHSYPYILEWYVDGEIMMDRVNCERWPEQMKNPWHRKYLGAGKGVFVDEMEDFFCLGAPKLEKLNVIGRKRGEAYDGELIKKVSEYNLTSSLGPNMEISDCMADKGRALQSLCRYLHISPGQAVAFGDGRNDIPLLRSAGIGIAMGNAVPEVKEISDAVTLTNMEDGVAYWLEQAGL